MVVVTSAEEFGQRRARQERRREVAVARAADEAAWVAERAKVEAAFRAEYPEGCWACRGNGGEPLAAGEGLVIEDTVAITRDGVALRACKECLGRSDEEQWRPRCPLCPFELQAREVGWDWDCGHQPLQGYEFSWGGHGPRPVPVDPDDLEDEAEGAAEVGE